MNEQTDSDGYKVQPALCMPTGITNLGAKARANLVLLVGLRFHALIYRSLNVWYTSVFLLRFDYNLRFLLSGGISLRKAG